MTEQDSSTAESANKQKQEVANDRPNFMGIPLTGWAIFAVSVIVVVFVAGHFTIKLYDEWQHALQDKNQIAGQAKKAAAINEDTSSYSNAVTKEMEIHKHDGSGHQISLHTDQAGKTIATFFDSDGCIAISRPGVTLPYLPQPQATLLWVLGPSKMPPAKAPSEALPVGASNIAVPAAVPTAASDFRQAAVSEVISDRGQGSASELLRIQVGCWTNGPHPWPFTTWWGPANGCWAAFYRRWNDGCTHYQMYNTCTGQWDPRITWISCNPQHHP
jgi:hypothetical protein